MLCSKKVYHVNNGGLYEYCYKYPIGEPELVVNKIGHDVAVVSQYRFGKYYIMYTDGSLHEISDNNQSFRFPGEFEIPDRLENVNTPLLYYKTKLTTVLYYSGLFNRCDLTIDDEYKKHILYIRDSILFSYIDGYINRVDLISGTCELQQTDFCVFDDFCYTGNKVGDQYHIVKFEINDEVKLKFHSYNNIQIDKFSEITRFGSKYFILNGKIYAFNHHQNKITKLCLGEYGCEFNGVLYMPTRQTISIETTSFQSPIMIEIAL